MFVCLLEVNMTMFLFVFSFYHNSILEVCLPSFQLLSTFPYDIFGLTN